MRFGSVCSGIGAVEYAWSQLGWECAFMAEIEPFARAVLQHHYPDVPLHGDFRTIEPGQYGTIDILAGGTPCQDFSIAGLRAGLDGERGSLTIEFVRLCERLKPRYVVFENVPGILSADEGKAFGIFLGAMADVGYYGAWDVLDSQWFGVAQRRRRLWAVFHLGDWRRAAAILLEPESLRGHTPPRRQARSGADAGIEIGPGGGCETDVMPTLDTRAKDGPIRNQIGGGYFRCAEVANTLARRTGSGRNGADLDTYVAFAQNQVGEVRASDVMGTLNTNSNASGRSTPMIAFRDVAQTLTQNYGKQPDNSHTDLGPNVVGNGHVVRRLTPEECESLQAFPQGYTAIQYRGKPAADGPRYRALGNSMTTSIPTWIGERIQILEELLAEDESAA